MTKRRSTKRALLLSALSLLMCISMLVGSTYAWFTDSVTSGRNIIQSGNLDVKLEYRVQKNGAWADDWAEVTSTTDIFGYDNWEPGYTAVAQFRVTNAGSLALKYQLTADVYEEVPGVNVAGETFFLSNYLYTAVVDENATREQILATTGSELKNKLNVEAKELKADADPDVVALAIWMPTTVGNEANYKGENVPSISFGINLLATQYTYENDSFDNQYDKYASVTTITDMKNALEEGITSFNFMGNKINLNYVLTKAMIPADSTVTISNAVVSGKSYGNAADGTVIFENCTFTNTGAYSIHFDAGNGDVIFKNCELYGWNSFGDTLNSVSFYDCSLYGNGTYGLIRSYADLYVENCYIDTTDANHSDNYPEGIEAVSGATLTEKNNTYVASTLSEVMNLAKKGNTTIDAKGANLGDYNYSGTFASGTVLKNAKFTYVYGASVDGLATFENCEFVSDHSYSANFSDGSYTGKVVFNNCYFDGWNSFGTAITSVVMNNCTFETVIGPYSLLRFYQDAVLNNCVIKDSFDGIDTNKTGTVVELNNCTGIEGKIYNNTSDNVVQVGKWIVNGVELTNVPAW